MDRLGNPSLLQLTTKIIDARPLRPREEIYYLASPWALPWAIECRPFRTLFDCAARTSAHLLKSRRCLTRHIESAFEDETHLSDQTVIEQSAEDRDAVRHAPRWLELGQRIIWIRGPVAARF